MLNVLSVIISRRSGTRLWPSSPPMYPMQSSHFFNRSGRTLPGAPLVWLGQELGFAAPTLLCNSDRRFLVREELDRKGMTPRAVILEPVARNTAAAVAVAALHVSQEHLGGILAVMPSDHVI